MTDLSNGVDKLTEDYQNLEGKLEKYKAFRDSLENDVDFRAHLQNSASTKGLEQMQEIEATVQQRQAIFSDKEMLTRRLEMYVGLNNLTAGFIIITLLILLVRLLKGR